MRILNDNVLNMSNTIFSSSDNNDNMENIFDSDIDYVGKFDSNTQAEITSTFTELKKVNSVSLFKTNAKVIIFEFYKEDNTIDKYILEKIETTNVFNIIDIHCKKIVIKIYGDAIENIYIGYLIIGNAIDFPPHSPAKTHKINFTREQFFSQSGKYFCRRIPFKQYEEWTVNFDFLTNENKDLILNFFNENDNNVFVLQVWRLTNNQKISVDNIAIYGVSKYGECVYGNVGIMLDKSKIVNQMTPGLYVITNNILEFKKTNNKIYQWSVSINFREVK